MSKTSVLEVLSVGRETKIPTDKGGYHAVEIAYKDNGKVFGKRLVDYKYPLVYKQVLGLKQGDQIEVMQDKEAGSDGREYWQWQELKLFSGQGEPVSSEVATSPKVSTAAPAAAVSKTTGRVLGSNYETPEERAARQVYIVRQSSITAALKYFEQTRDVNSYTIADVVNLAEQLKEYVFNGTENAKKAQERTPTKERVPAAVVEAGRGVPQESGVAQEVAQPKRRGRPAKQTVVDPVEYDLPPELR